jgi:F-box protein 11
MKKSDAVMEESFEDDNDYYNNTAVYVVDQILGPYKTINEAIEKADNNSVIKISPGLYTENIKIINKSLRLEPKDKISDVIIVVNGGPVFYIENNLDHKVTIQNFKISHTAISDDMENIQKFDEKREIVMGTFMSSNQPALASDPDDPKSSFAITCPIEKNMNTLVLLQSGRMTLRDCVLSLHFLQRSTETPLPAVILNKGTESNLENLDIKGNQMNPTVGIIVRQCDTVIKECKINKHLKGGILIYGDDKPAIKIHNCKFSKNSTANIEITGKKFLF